MIASPASPPTLRQRLQPFIAADVFDFWASHLNPALSWNRPLARIVRMQRECRDAVTLELRTNRHFRGLLPGQHLNLTVDIDGVRFTRSYSPSRISADGRNLWITVREVSGGRVSTYLNHHALVGQVLELSSAYGGLTWPQNPSGHWALLAAGSGITPLMSLVRSLAHKPCADLRVDLVYWSRSRDTQCFASGLRELTAQDPRFRVHFGLTGESATGPDEFDGRPQVEALMERLPDLARSQVYACGPAGFVATLRGQLAQRSAGFAAEAFTPAPIQTAPGATVRVHLLRSNRVLDLPTDRALLPALEAQGLKPAHGCRMGLCNTCVCEKRAGTTQNLNSGAADSEPAPALRLCINRAQSDLTLDL